MMEFKLSRRQLTELMTWELSHKKSCPYSDVNTQGAIGGCLTYTFTPTSLGIVTKVKCVCGGEEDITSYDEW